MGLIPKIPKTPKIIPAATIHSIVEDVIITEIGKMPILDAEKQELKERVEKLPKGLGKIWTYQKELKSVLADVSAKGGSLSRINQEINEKTS